MSKTVLYTNDMVNISIIDTEDCIIDGTKRTMRYKHVLGSSDKHESLEPKNAYNLASHRTGQIMLFGYTSIPPGSIRTTPTATDPLGHVVHVHYYECDELPGWIFEMLHDAWTQNNRRDRTALEEVDELKKKYIEETEWKTTGTFYDYLDPMATKGEWEKALASIDKDVYKKLMDNSK